MLRLLFEAHTVQNLSLKESEGEPGTAGVQVALSAGESDGPSRDRGEACVVSGGGGGGGGGGVGAVRFAKRASRGSVDMMEMLCCRCLWEVFKEYHLLLHSAECSQAHSLILDARILRLHFTVTCQRGSKLFKHVISWSNFGSRVREICV